MTQRYSRRTVLSHAVGTAAGAALLASAKPSQAAGMQFKSDLKGASEVPPTTSSGTGMLTASYDPATKTLTWSGSFSGLTGPATAAHFHGPAEAGKNAGVAVWISEKAQPFSSPFEGSATLTDAQATDLQKGMWYVNVHTAASCAASS